MSPLYPFFVLSYYNLLLALLLISFKSECKNINELKQNRTGEMSHPMAIGYISTPIFNYTYDYINILYCIIKGIKHSTF